MALDALIFDVDGTLVDSNEAHVEAWRQAFAEHGWRIPADRIRREIGKGGDQLVPSILGRGVELLFERHDTKNEEALAYLEQRLHEIGVIAALEKAGFEPGDDVRIGEHEFELHV